GHGHDMSRERWVLPGSPPTSATPPCLAPPTSYSGTCGRGRTIRSSVTPWPVTLVPARSRWCTHEATRSRRRCDASGTNFLAPLPIPDLHRLVGAGGGEALAIGAEADAEDLSGVAGEGEDFLPALGVPHLHRPVRAGGGQACAVGAEADAE